MKEFLKIEKVNTLKSIFATFIDIILTVGLGLILFFFAITPLFEAFTPLGSGQNYMKSQEVVADSDDKVGYNLTLEDGLGYERYIYEAKCFYEYHEDRIVEEYYKLALKDESVEPEYKDRFKDIHLIYNYSFLGLDYKADPVTESSYSNSYFIYQFDPVTQLPLWNEYGIDNPRTLELNERGIAERNDYVYLSYTSLNQILTLIDSNYYQAYNDVSLYNNLSAFTTSAIAYAIFFIFMPLILRNHATIGRKIFGYGYIKTNGAKLPWYIGFSKSLVAMVLPLLGMFFFSIYSLIILVVFPVFVNLMYYMLKARDQDLLDTIFKMQIIDIKNSLFFESEEAEAEYLKSESLEDYDEEELDYTNRLSNLATLDLKSVEEKIEDEQRNNENSK